MKRIISVLISLLVLSSMLLAACGAPAEATEEAKATVAPAAPAAPAVTEAPAATEAPAEPKIITIAYSQEPDNVTGEYSNMTYAVWLSQLVMAGLGKWDANNNFIPDLAVDVPTGANGGVSTDGLTITWKLKPGLLWSDGQPLTSKDVVFTWQSQVDPANSPISRFGWDKITGIDTPDETTAVIHFKELYPAWQTLFTLGPNTGAAILPEHIFAGKTGLEKDPEVHQPTVGAGPFKISEWVAGDHMTLVRNDNYYQGKAKLDQINIKFIPDPATALSALKTGDVDFVPDFAESDIPTIGALEPAQHLRVDATPEFEHMFFNLGITNSTVKGADGKVVGNSDVAGFCPFQDVNVRKAIMLGIDRQTLVDTLLFGKTTVPASLWPNSAWYNSSLSAYPYDAAQANSLLDAAGYKAGADGIREGSCDGKPVKFSLGIETTTKQLRVDYVLAIQDMLKQIGVEIKPNHVPSGTFFGAYTAGADMQTGKFDMAIYTTGFYPDPDSGDSFLCSGVPAKDHQTGQNNYHYCDQTGEMDKLFAAGIASADPAARKTAYDAIQKFQYDNVIIMPLYARANVYGYADRFVFPASSGYAGWAGDAFNFDVK